MKRRIVDNEISHPVPLAQDVRQQLDELLAAAGVSDQTIGPDIAYPTINNMHLQQLVGMINAAGHSHLVGAYNAADDEMSVGEAKEMANHHGSAMTTCLSWPPWPLMTAVARR